MEIKKILGKRIKELRKKRGMSQEELSEKLGIAQNSLSYIERGENFLTAETMEKLINALDIEVQELFNYSHLRSTEILKQEIIETLENRPELIEMTYKYLKTMS